MGQALVRALQDIAISGGRIVLAGELCFIGRATLERLVKAESVEVLQAPSMQTTRPSSRLRVSKGPVRSVIRVVVRGPFRWAGRARKDGEVLYVGAAVYRLGRKTGSLEREFTRDTFRGVSFLRAVTCGARSRRGPGVETRGSCREQREIHDRQHT